MEIVIRYLQDFGLAEKEAKIYLILSKLGSTTAMDIASASQYSKLQTYRALKGLLDRGLIEISIERPRRYTPLNIEQTIALLEQDAKKKVLELENKKTIVLKEWEGIPGFRKNQAKYTFRIINGFRNVSKFSIMLYDSAEKEISIIVKGEKLNKEITEGVDDVLEKLSKKDVPFKKISEINKDNILAAKRFLDIGELRHIPIHDLAQLSIIDDREVLIGLTGEGNGGDIDSAIWTNHPDLVKTMKGFFNILWEITNKADIRIEEIESG